MSGEELPRNWSQLSERERRAHFQGALDNPKIGGYWKRVMLEAIFRGCGWSGAMKEVDQQSSRIKRDWNGGGQE